MNSIEMYDKPAAIFSGSDSAWLESGRQRVADERSNEHAALGVAVAARHTTEKYVLTIAGAILCTIGVFVSGPNVVHNSSFMEREDTPVYSDHRLIWGDEFHSLSLRSGGPTYAGFSRGVGTWAPSQEWYSSDARGFPGYGYDWFVDPVDHVWPVGYPAYGQFSIVPEGIRIRSEAYPSEWPRNLLPAVRGISPPWIAGILDSARSRQFKPPFYIEFCSKMPSASDGQAPFPALWLLSAHRNPSTPDEREFEIDVHEGFAESTRLNSSLHWTSTHNRNSTIDLDVVRISANSDLSLGFNLFSAYVGREGVIFYFNRIETGRVRWPSAEFATASYGIRMNISAGVAFQDTHPTGGPYDLTIRYVHVWAQDNSGMWVD